MAKVIMTRKHGLELWLVVCGKTIVGSFMSERYATHRAAQINNKYYK